MEIGQQGADDPEAEAGIDEDIGFSGAGRDASCRILGCGIFESPDSRGPYGNNAAVLGKSTVDLPGSLRRDGETLAVYLVLFNVFHAHRLEGAQAHMQGDFRDIDAVLADAGENFRSEMQAGSRGGHTVLLLRIDSLIAFAIFGAVGAADIGRQRHMSDALHHSKEVIYRVEPQCPLTKFATSGDFSLEFRHCLLAKINPLANANLTAGTHQRLPLPLTELPGKKNFYLSLKEIAGGWIPGTDRLRMQSCAAAKQAGRKDAAVIDHQQIVWAKQIGELDEVAILIFPGCPAQMQHARGAAVGQRLLRNQLPGKMKVKIRNQH